MPSTRDLRRRIRSVKGTQQITKAMQMVAAAKLRRAQQRIVEARPYSATLARVLASLAARTEHTHPLLTPSQAETAWLVVITSDKGLCGAFNNNLLREAGALVDSDRWESVEIVAVGKKAVDFFRKRRNAVVHAETEMMSHLTAKDGPRLADDFIRSYTSGQVGSVWLMYNRFLSLIRHERVLARLLPVEPPTGPAVAEPNVDYIYEPDAATILAELLPRHVQVQVQTALYDSAAAEQAARMTAMDAATKNAHDMIKHLTLVYNRTRQAAITKELIEIVSGAQALEE